MRAIPRPAFPESQGGAQSVPHGSEENETGKGTAPSTDEDSGVLLGWDSSPAGQRIMLLMQSARKTPDQPDDVRDFRYFLAREQTVQLGNCLYGLAGETAPKRKSRGFLEKLIGD
jgi:hypothetical protein